MVRKLFYSLMFCIIYINCFSQEIIEADGEYTYVVPDNIDLERAKQIALERAMIQIIANEFGTIISQTNSTSIKNNNGNSDLDFISIRESDIKGEWIETTVSPIFKTEVIKDHLIVKVWVSGKIRKTTTSNINFSARILRNGTEDKFEDDTFNDGDDLFLSFLSPINGFIVAYLVDNNGMAYCLLPYQNSGQGNVAIKANQRYVFFSAKHSTTDLQSCVDEYKITCSKSQEYNNIYVIFSPNSFVKAVDNKQLDTLPRVLTEREFQKWLSSSRVKDSRMTLKKFQITIHR